MRNCVILRRYARDFFKNAMKVEPAESTCRRQIVEARHFLGVFYSSARLRGELRATRMKRKFIRPAAAARAKACGFRFGASVVKSYVLAFGAARRA